MKTEAREDDADRITVLKAEVQLLRQQFEEFRSSYFQHQTATARGRSSYHRQDQTHLA